MKKIVLVLMLVLVGLTNVGAEEQNVLAKSKDVTPETDLIIVPMAEEDIWDAC